MIRNNKISLEPPTLARSGESRYLSRLWVCGNGERPEELSRFESSQSTITGGFELKANNLDPHNQKIHKKIITMLKLSTFREQHILLQFWSPHVVGNHQVLTTIDQPYGVGVIDERLNSYRRDSERNLYVVDKDNEDDLSPLARVFRRRLSEWTCDLANYSPKHFPQQEYAIHCNLRGYLALPVFDSTTRLCVGVLELLTTSKYMTLAYEVQQVNNALKAQNLTTQVLESPTSDVHNESRHVELEKIFTILKFMCDIHRLPLAQTWAVSPLCSVVSHEQSLKMSCNSFDTRCLGKVCMSTASLPFHVQDLRLWPFRKACRELHLDNSHGLVGKAFLSRGSCFCEDLTKLSEEEYPLVDNAHMSELSSCFAIFLHSVESNDDYVLEFFLPLHREDGRYVQNLVQTLKHNIEMASGFELGDKSPIHVVGPRTEASSQYLDIDPHNSTMISWIATTNTQIPETVSSDSESFVADADITNSTHVVNQLSPQQDIFNNQEGTITSTQNLVSNLIIRDNIDVIGARDNENAASDHDMSMQLTNDTISDVGEKHNHVKSGRKRKLDSLTMEAVMKHLGKPMDDAAKSLGVTRSTLTRFCRDHNMPSWPLPKHNKKTVRVTDLKLSKKSPSKQNLQQWALNTRFRFSDVVILLVRVKRWSCSSKNHGFSGKWWSCGKHSYLPFKLDSMYQVARLMLSLKRWRNKKSNTHTIQNRDHPKNKINIINPVSSLGYASPKQIKASVVSDIRKATVKATFKYDMIKFQIPISSGLFELEKEVAHRIKLQSKRLRLKYRDEDDDLILLACDADLHNLLGISTSNNSIIKLIIMADE